MEKKLDIISKYRNELMGFAALWIFIFHVRTPTLEFNRILHAMEGFVQRIGFCGVDIFLLLSGMGLTYSIKKSSLSAFYGKRLRRVLFPFLVVAIVRAILEKWPLDLFLAIVTGYRFITVEIYSCLWFVPAIVILYLCFPLYYRFFERAKNKVLFTVGAVEVWFVVTLLFRDSPRMDMFGFTNRIPVFLIGILIGWMIQNNNFCLSRTFWLFACVNLAVGIYLAYLSNNKMVEYLVIPASNCIPNIFISISLAYLISLVMSWLPIVGAGGKVSGILRGVLAFYGKMSLEFYCVQEKLAALINSYLPEQMHAVFRNLIHLACATVAAYLLYVVGQYFWKFVDHIKNSLKQKVQSGREVC